MSEESESAEPQIIADEYDASGYELQAIVEDAAEPGRSFSGIGMVAAAREPDHDRQWPLRFLAGAPNVEVKTVLGALYAIAGQLGAHGTVMAAVPHSFPAGCCCRRCPSQCADWRLGIGNTLESEHLAFDHS